MTKFSNLKGVVLMNTKKIVAMIIALIMTTATFAGCGNNTVDHKDTEVSSTVETTIDKDVDKTVEEESDEKSETADKADKKDSKETSNKAEKPNDNKVADKSDKDKGSANNSNSSVSKPNSGNANNNGSASKPSTPAKPNKPSGNSNSGSSNNGNHNGSVNKPSKPAEKPSKPVEKPVEKPSEPSKPAPHVHNYNTVVSSTNGDCSHVGKVTKKCNCGATVTENGSYGDHKWKNQYKEVHHDAKYEERPVYKWVAYDKCRKCGFQTEHETGDIIDHAFECGGTYTTFEKQIQTGTESVQVEKPWTEQVPDGKKCTICGTHNH